MKIIVDADACPVMDDIAEIAELYEVHAWYVCNYSHVLEFDSPFIEVKLIDQLPDAVDFYIANAANPDDIVVTDDIGLVGMLLARGAYAVSGKGKVFSPRKIDRMLERRHRSRKLRKAGVKLRGGPPAFQESDRKQFRKTLARLLNKITREYE